MGAPLGISFYRTYPTTAQAGLGRAGLDANTNWAHLYAQDDWQITSRLKVDFGLRYEYNRNMTDSNNQMAAVDTATPGGRFVIAGSTTGLTGLANTLLPFIPIPYVSAAAAGWNDSLLTPCQDANLRLAAPGGVHRHWEFAGSGKDSDSRGLWDLPEPGCLQHHQQFRAEPAFLRYEDSEHQRHGAESNVLYSCYPYDQLGGNGWRKRPAPGSRFQDRVQRSVEPEPGAGDCRWG